MKRYEMIDHTADMGIRVFGKTLEEMYENAGWSYLDLIAEPEQVSPKKERLFLLKGETYADLLRNLLVELILATQIDWELYSQFQVEKLQLPELHIRARGEDIDEERHTITLEIKAVTYHELKVYQSQGYWVGEVIFDI